MQCKIKWYDVSTGEVDEYTFEDVDSLDDIQMVGVTDNPWDKTVLGFVHKGKSFSVKTVHFLTMTID